MSDDYLLATAMSRVVMAIALATGSISIYKIYIAPLQGNYSEALPTQAQAKIKVLRSL